ncbi:MAG: ABC-2 transporter permease [Phycisphaerales bacterium]|jgi:ABC-type transport system involved in multi-copper enzyme maturation permease subunit|nr:ABC-2 transporter permease [Phycisphaerales bacterium]MDP6890375.1 ABC-2 transporter permease [Phycisphaerales bacterium]
MISQILTIAQNTFFESLRQPVTLVVVAAAALLLVMSNPLAAFTMGEDQRMLVDLGLATIFLAGAVLASFLATNVVGREITNRTALTVISKPVSRPVFILGKYFGVLMALLLACLALTLIFMLVEMHAVLQTVRDPIHVPVLLFGFGGVLLAALAAVWCNYFYGMAFTSTVIFMSVPVLLVAYFLSLNFEPDFGRQPMLESFKGNIWLATIALGTCVAMLAAIAVAVSTRLGQVMTLAVTVGLFVLGLLSDWIFGRLLRGMESDWLARATEAGLTDEVEFTTIIERTSGEIAEKVALIDQATVPLTDMASSGEVFGWSLLKVGYAVLPNFQVLWLSDAVTQDIVIPSGFLIRSVGYGLIYTLAALAVGVALFQRRDLG